MVYEFFPELSIKEMIYTFLIPFLITFSIFFGVLSALRIFNKRINIVLSFSLTIAAAYGGLFNLLSSYLLQLGAYVGVIAFFIVFVLGIAFWGFGKGKEIYYRVMAPHERLKKIDKEMSKIEKKIKEARESGKKEEEEALWRTWESLQRERRIAEMELKQQT